MLLLLLLLEIVSLNFNHYTSAIMQHNCDFYVFFFCFELLSDPKRSAHFSQSPQPEAFS
jgi:hypothetical protein